MKTKIICAISLMFLFACSGEQANKEQTQDNKAVSTKFILKASNGQYVTISPEQSLIANQPDAAKAERFDIIDVGNGKSNIKASNGKFVCGDQGAGGNVTANRDQAGEWETFEIIKLDQSKINLKASNAKFVCADQGKDNKLIANRDAAGEWETFTVEIQ